MNFKHIANRLRVMARATPEDKHALVVGLRDLSCTVAVTGDGINDVKALRAANIGLAMGSGCEIAKESADLILMDDNFGSTMNAVMWGRNIFNNIRKFLQFQLTITIAILAIILVASILFGEAPFSVIQLLWINMVMDTLAALALATEPPHPTVLKGRPVRGCDKIFSQVMWRTILGVAAWEFLVMLFLLLIGPLIFGPAGGYGFDYLNANDYVDGVAQPKVHMYTIMFNAFVFMNIFNFFNARLLGINEYQFWEVFQNPIRNMLFLVLVAGITSIQVLMILFGGQLFRTVPLSMGEWITCICLGLATLGVGVGLRFSPPEWVEKIPVSINETDDVGSQDRVMKAFKQTTQKKKPKKIN